MRCGRRTASHIIVIQNVRHQKTSDCLRWRFFESNDQRGFDSRGQYPDRDDARGGLYNEAFRNYNYYEPHQLNVVAASGSKVLGKNASIAKNSIAADAARHDHNIAGRMTACVAASCSSIAAAMVEDIPGSFSTMPLIILIAPTESLRRDLDVIDPSIDRLSGARQAAREAGRAA